MTRPTSHPLRRLAALLLTVATMAVAGCLPASAKKYVDELPSKSEVINGFSTDRLRRQLATAPLHHIEGIWRFPADDLEIAICRENIADVTTSDAAAAYRMVLLHSSNRALRPGTVIGHVSPTAKRSVYDARIYTRALGSSMINPKRFILSLDDEESRMLFEMRKSAFSVNLWRLLPFAWRYTVHRNRQQESTAGCVRVFPAPQLPLEPVYL